MRQTSKAMGNLQIVSGNPSKISLDHILLHKKEFPVADECNFAISVDLPHADNPRYILVKKQRGGDIATPVHVSWTTERAEDVPITHKWKPRSHGREAETYAGPFPTRNPLIIPATGHIGALYLECLQTRINLAYDGVPSDASFCLIIEPWLPVWTNTSMFVLGDDLMRGKDVLYLQGLEMKELHLCEERDARDDPAPPPPRHKRKMTEPTRRRVRARVDNADDEKG